LLISASFGRQRNSQPVEFKRISNNLYEILGGRGSRTGAYIGDNGVLLIDSKMNENSVNQVTEGIRKFTDKPIKYLVNTHSDGDHIAGNRYLPKTVTFIAHENCRKDFFGPDRSGNPSEWNKPELSPFVPSVTFRARMDIYLGSKKIELWYFGVGHTTGDTVVYFPEEKTAFIGDQIFLTRPQLIHSYKGGNSLEHIKTLNKMLDAIDAEKFCSGHSEIANRAAIKSHIAQMKKRQEKVEELMKQGKNLEQVKAEFVQAEGRLIESIYSEVPIQEAFDIAEITFRYQFKDNASGQQQKAPAYFLSLFGKDPTPEFLKRFAGHKPPVRKGSEFEIMKGLKFIVTRIKRVTRNKVEVSGGYYEAGLSSSGNTYVLEKKNGKWTVTKNTMHWIS
jgi:glyoxylase-like metal-dependent hydrolase (beta-lactamase superfamily II)